MNHGKSRVNIENDANRPDVVPTYVYDDQCVRAAHRDRLHWAAHFVMLAGLLITVGMFIWYLNQYDYTSGETITVDGADGIANYIGKDGAIYNGENYGEAHPLAHEEERGQ